MTEVPPSDESSSGEYLILIDWLRNHFNHLSDETITQLLWSCTCYPFGTAAQVATMFQEYYDRADGDPSLMISLADKDMDAAMTEYQQSGE